MAIDTINVTKVSVSQQMDKLWNIVLNLTCSESAVEVINQDFSIRYRTGQDAEAKAKELLGGMQAAIDEWNSEQGVFDAAALDNAVTYIQANLTS